MHGTLDLRRLRYFLSIAEHGSLSAAARALNVAQPALSYHVAELERLLKLTLVLRGRDGTRLTPEGDVLRRHAIEIVQRVDEAERVLEQLAGKASSAHRIRIAIITSLAADLTSLLVERARQTNPDLKLSIIEAGTREIETRIRQSRIDVAVSLSPADETDARPVASEDLLFVGPPYVAQGHAISEHHLSEFDFVLPAPGNPLRDFVESMARSRGFTINTVLEVDGPRSRFNAVASGIGCTFLGAHSIPLADTGRELCAVPVSPPLRRPIYIVRRRGLDATLVTSMQEMICAALGDLGLAPFAGDPGQNVVS